jgi:hypothetical protein
MRTYEQEIVLPGGNVGGAVRVGDTVRRPTGPWTPAVHALLEHLAGSGLPHVPRVRGLDARGREVLDYLPGTVIDVDVETLSRARLGAIARWARDLHAVLAGFTHPGPWRFGPDPGGAVICHNDLAPWNACFEGDELVGIFDWDCAGPSSPLLELAFTAWSGVPLWRAGDPAEEADRIRAIAENYGRYEARDILYAVPYRIERMVENILSGAAAGDPGMARLLGAGEPQRTRAARSALLDRIPAIAAEL